MEDCGLTLPCDRHFRIKWWCQLVCSDAPVMVQPWTVGQVDEAEQEHEAKMVPSLRCVHPSMALQWWLLRAACYGEEVLSITASIMEDESLSSGTYQLRLLFKWFLLFPWRLVWKAEYCAKVAAFPPSFHDEVRWLSTEWRMPACNILCWFQSPLLLVSCLTGMEPGI